MHFWDMCFVDVKFNGIVEISFVVIAFVMLGFKTLAVYEKKMVILWVGSGLEFRKVFDFDELVD